MKLKRQNFLLFLAGGAGTVALAMSTRSKKSPMPITNPTAQTPVKSEPSFAFKSIKGLLPLETSAIAPKQQLEQYSKYEVVDDLLLPEGFSYELIAPWGDKVGDSRFGYDNDYLSFIANGKDRGYLTVNFEYISAYPWMQTYEQVIGKSLPFKQVQNLFGLAGNKYGWIVEVDPANPNNYGTKHTWLGRYRHEAVGVSVAGKQLAFYSGCDRTGGHVYKFVSRDRVRDPKDKTNSQLWQNGTFYAAKFNSDGTGSWIFLKTDTPIKPGSPSHIECHLLRLGNEPVALTFRWQILAMGGEPAEGGAGFSNPDNLLADHNGVWVVTDMTCGKDCVGNNSIWYIPTSGANAGKAYLFGIGPMECQNTRRCFTRDEQTILSIQHAGEGHGIRRDRAIGTQKVITTTKGEKFQQIRSVPVGSNWPDKSNNAPPKLGVVAIQRYRQSV